jgi:hypothetical protein
VSLLRQCCCEEIPPPLPCECESSEDWPSSFIASNINFTYKFELSTPFPVQCTCSGVCSSITDEYVEATVSSEANIVMNRIGTSCNYYGVGTVSVGIGCDRTHVTHANPICNGTYTTSAGAIVEVPCCIHITCHYEKVCGCGEDMTTNPARCKGPAVYYHKLEICDFTVACNASLATICDCDPTPPSTTLVGLSCNGAKLVYASNFAPVVGIQPLDCVSMGWYGPCKNAVCPSCTYCPFGCCVGDCNEADFTLSAAAAGPFSIAITDPCDENEPPDPCTNLRNSGLLVKTAPRAGFPGNVSALLTNTSGGVDESWTETNPCYSVQVSLIQSPTSCDRPWIYT